MSASMTTADIIAAYAAVIAGWFVGLAIAVALWAWAERTVTRGWRSRR